MKKYISMIYEGPFASFGSSDKTENRNTEFFPTLSQIIGLILAARGCHGFADEIKKLTDTIKVNVYSFNDINYMFDFQIIGAKTKIKEMVPSNIRGGHPGAAIVKKTYLQDVKFGIILEITDESIANEIVDSLQHPVWPLYLGRKNCIPTSKIFRGLFETYAEAKSLLENEGKFIFYVTRNRIDDYDESFFINDFPIQFSEIQNNEIISHKKYCQNKVYIKNYE